MQTRPVYMTILCALAVLFALCGVVASPVQAVADLPLDVPNCKHGVHVLSPSDETYNKVAKLLNTNGGKDCWVTQVFLESEMTTGNLQRVNDLLRENNLQMVYRLERGFDQNHTWLMPNRATTQKFIDAIKGKDGEPGLNPYGKDMYVTLGNEPTHAAMCGGCTPAEMAHWVKESIDMLHAAEKDLDIDIHVSMGGHDLASPQDPSAGYYDAGYFMQEMFKAEPDLPCAVDFWVGHYYPPSMTGSAFGSGRLSPYGYEWELDMARAHAKPECRSNIEALKVFITETGYKVGLGGISDDFAYVNTLNMLRTYEKDDRVFGFTFFPFIFCGEPFENMAIAGCDGTVLNGVGRALYEAPKIAGMPRHIRKARTVVTCPEKLVENVEVECLVSAKNLGTDIWEDLEGDYRLDLVGESEGSQARFSRFRDVKPGSTLTATLHFNPGAELGSHDIMIGLEQQNKLLLGLAVWRVTTYKTPQLAMTVKNVLGTDVDAEGVQMQVFDTRDNLKFATEFTVVDGHADIGEVTGVGLDTCYRVVLLVDKNLPVQKECMQFTDGVNEVEMPRLLAIDRNSDGKLSLADILSSYSQ